MNSPWVLIAAEFAERAGGPLSLRRSLQLAKNVLHVRGVDTAGKVMLQRILRRSEVREFFCRSRS